MNPNPRKLDRSQTIACMCVCMCVREYVHALCFVCMCVCCVVCDAYIYGLGVCTCINGCGIQPPLPFALDRKPVCIRLHEQLKIASNIQKHTFYFVCDARVRRAVQIQLPLFVLPRDTLDGVSSRMLCIHAHMCRDLGLVRAFVLCCFRWVLRLKTSALLPPETSAAPPAPLHVLQLRDQPPSQHS